MEQFNKYPSKSGKGHGSGALLLNETSLEGISVIKLYIFS
jgi:hypothetical protein